MAADSPENFRLTALNPGGRDSEQQFHSVPDPGEGPHPPINFHAFAACTFGAFHRDTRGALDEKTPVLLLLRSDFRASERALTDLKKEGCTVAVSLKETGLHQIAQQLRDPAKLSRFINIVTQADPYIATTPQPWRLFRLPTRSRINSGIFLCRATSSPAFSSAHANGTCPRETISRRCWLHESCAKRRANRSRPSIWMATKGGDC